MSNNSFLCTQKLRIPKPTPFGGKMLTPFQKYNMELENNARILTSKFPNQSFLKIKQLLEQLDNDIQMVEDLLQQQTTKLQPQNKIRQSNTQNNFNHQEQNKILKKAIASLYNKLKQTESKVKNLEEDNEKLSNEKQFYKNRNKLLSEEQFCQQFSSNSDIF